MYMYIQHICSDVGNRRIGQFHSFNERECVLLNINNHIVTIVTIIAMSNFSV